MNEEQFINELKKSNVILIDDLHRLFISKQKVEDAAHKVFNSSNAKLLLKELGIE